MEPKTRVTDITPIAWTVKTLAMIFLISGQAVAEHADPDAARIVEKVQQHYEDSIQHIDDFEVVMGKHTNFYKKAQDNGHPYFKFERRETEQAQGLDTTSSESGFTLLTPSTFSKLKENARYEGEDVVDGHPVHVLYTDNLDLDIEEADHDVTMKNARFYIDSDDWILRQVSFTAEIELEDGRTQKVDPVTTFKDYRDVEGMMVAFKTVTHVTGLFGMLTDQERREAEQAMKELEKIPAAQREMAERMMGDKISKYKKMLEDDRMETVHEIDEVRVNTGG